MKPVPAAALAPVPAMRAAVPAIDAAWKAALAGWLSSRKTYPEEARRRGVEGKVVVRFTIDHFGRVLDASIVAGAGSDQLDAAALALVRSAALPPFPSTMPQERVTITSAIRYELR